LNGFDIKNNISDYEFVQGNFLFANKKTWSRCYLPITLKHYGDDNYFAFMCEYFNGKKIFTHNQFWKHSKLDIFLINWSKMAYE